MSIGALCKLCFAVSILVTYKVEANPLARCQAVINLRDNITDIQAAVTFNDPLSNPTFKVSRAVCLNTRPPSDLQMERWLRALGSDPLPWVEVNGVRFENETPERIEIYKMLASEKNNSVVIDKVQGEQKIFNQHDRPIGHKTRCKKVDCAIKELFGEKEGLRMAYLYGNYRLNGSHLRFSASPYSAKELDEVIVALGDLPKDLFPLAQDTPIVRITRDHAHGNNQHPCTLANSSMQLFDLWSAVPSDVKRETIIHELAHSLTQQKLKGLDISEEWLALSKWNKKEGSSSNAAKGADAKDFVSEYAMTSPREDFAESFAAYVYEPQKLKKGQPQKYSFLKEKVFGNREFTDASNCPNK